MSAIQNQAEVLGFNNGSVYQSILTFVNDVRLSDNTRASYMNTFKDFFTYICTKDISLLTEEDITTHGIDQNKIKITNERVKNYRTHLKNGKGLSNTSINQKMRAIASLFKELAKDRDHVNAIKVQLKSLPEPKNNHYGLFTKEEVDQLLEHLKNQAGGLQKYLLAKLAIKTSYRKNYLLSLTWKDVRKFNDTHYEIKGKAEGTNKLEEDKTIEVELYEELLQLKEGNDKNDTIFKMHPKTASLMIKEAVDKLGFDPDSTRMLAFHSLKVRGINEVYEKTRDVRKMQQQGNHASAETTLGIYARLTKDPLSNPSLLVGKDVDGTVINDATHEDLLIAINMCDDFVKTAIMEKLNAIRG